MSNTTARIEPEAWGPAEARAWVARHGGNISALARRLRVSRSRLQDWLSETGRSELPSYIQAHMETIDKVAALNGSPATNARGERR